MFAQYGPTRLKSQNFANFIIIKSRRLPLEISVEYGLTGSEATCKVYLFQNNEIDAKNDSIVWINYW